MPHPVFHRFGRRHARPLTLAVAALAASAWVAPALAQHSPAPPPPSQEQHGGRGHGPMGGHGYHHHRGGMGGLFYRREDKALTAAEVQKIAEAFLLWHGERSWKIANLREAANNTVEFSITTAEGSPIARFSVDRKTGRPQRIG
jgi:hypothetical protein